ncbi:MAG: hypothetical protein AB7C92_03310 [Synergistaceae bacterium]
MLSKFFRRINSGNSPETYAKHNRRTTVLNAANRKYAANHGSEAPRSTIIYPSKKSVHGEIIIAVDTSGSISDDKMETARIVGEILRMTVTFNHWEDRDVEIIYCGTRLRKDGPFKARSAELDGYIEDIKENGIKTCGCVTDLLPIWEEIISESDATRKYPFGLVVITGSETLNDEKIVSLYKSGKFRVPTLIIYSAPRK